MRHSSRWFSFLPVFSQAYAFARMTFRGRDFLFLLLLSTMMIPPTVLLIPNFLVLKELGLVDTVWGVLLPGFAGAFGVFLLRQWMLNLPSELEHAARIDGCSTWGILRHVILPLSKPALITLGIFTFMGAWNAFEWPLVVLSNQDYYPLTVGPQSFPKRLLRGLAADIRCQRHGIGPSHRHVRHRPALPRRRHQPEWHEGIGRYFMAGRKIFSTHRSHLRPRQPGPISISPRSAREIQTM